MVSICISCWALSRFSKFLCDGTSASFPDEVLRILITVLYCDHLQSQAANTFLCVQKKRRWSVKLLPGNDDSKVTLGLLKLGKVPGLFFHQVCQVQEGSGEHGKMAETDCKIICGAPMTLTVKG